VKWGLSGHHKWHLAVGERARCDYEVTLGNLTDTLPVNLESSGVCGHCRSASYHMVQ
jgi:hypothetical protein